MKKAITIITVLIILSGLGYGTFYYLNILKSEKSAKEAINKIMELPKDQTTTTQTDKPTKQPSTKEPSTKQPQPKTTATTPAWQNTELTDVLTDKKFKISDFAGKTILLESFAVWCPTCLAQQKQMKNVNSGVIHISLDTDPNENAALVKKHANRNNLNWRFAISPASLTRVLIDEFGIGVASAPSAPVILICKDSKSRLLKNGLKSADTIKSEINKGC